MACEIKYPCLHCGQQHPNAGALARHKAKHVPPGGFLCSVCKAPFTTVEARQMHKREAHTVYHCRVCRDTFSVVQEYLDHIANKHDGILKKPHEICDTCGSQFPTKTQLRHHAESNCGTEKRFKCEICNRSYQTTASLKTHKRSHQIGKTELCGFCGASFLNRGQLKIHERVHTGEKPYKCDKCDKAFGYRESLITHSTVHSGIKPFFCKCCDSRFSCVGNLIKHRKLRPETCGLPEYNPTNRVTPRPTKKTMPCLTDRKKSLTLADPFKKRLENESDTRTVSSELASENKCREFLDIRTSERITNHSLHDDGDVVSDYNSEYGSEEAIDTVTMHYEEDDKQVLLEDIDPHEGQPIDDIFEKKGNEQTSDDETLSFPEDVTSSMARGHSAVTNETIAQKSDTKEINLLINNENIFHNLEPHCSQDNEENCEKQPYLVNMSITDEPGEHVEILTIQFIQDEEQSNDEKSERSTSPNTLKTSDGLGGDDQSCVTEEDAVKLECESKSQQNETKSPNLASKDVCAKLESSIVSADMRGSPEISIPYSETEKEDKELQAQLEIVRTNSVTSTNMFACKLCPLQYTTVYLMARHLERIHNFQLEKAREKLKFAKETIREKRFRCKYCNLSYVNAARLNSHLGKHGADGRLIHKCPACARYFETQEMARQHALEQHRTRLVCDLCDKEFKEPESLQQHVRYAHKGMKELRKRRYMCHRCGKYFITRNSMSDHERANCGQSPIHRCETCGKHYASFGSLKVHQTMHQNLLPYECEYCGKRFRIKGQLKVHERSHTGEKPFRCEHCPKSFPYRESLLVHQVSHTGVKRFACSGCAQTFTCISNLQAHRRYHQVTCGAVPNNTKPLQNQLEKVIGK